MALSKGSKGFLAALVVVLLLVGSGVVLLNTLGSGTELSGDPVTVVVPEGAGASAVAVVLEEQGVIRSSTAFRVRARFDDRATQIKPGTYELTPGMSADEILEILAQGPPPPPTFRVTIPEGLTVPQTLARIADADQSPFTVDELRAALEALPVPEWVPADQLPPEAEVFEGLLFPDTYEFVMEATPTQVLERLVAQTRRVLDGITVPEGLDPYGVLVIGSLVEREARLREEQPRISSVIHNRLEIGMRLEIDATVLYALGEHRERVLYRDLEIESPWNTYRNAGLPPTPISGAGVGAIQAAASPADEDYLYYVVIDPETGEHGFSRTLEEHNRRRSEAGS